MKLLFVYNADAGKWNAILDSLHKKLSPDTYACHLCAITYGTFTMEEKWQAFLSTISPKPQFLHRNEFKSIYPTSVEPLPAVFCVVDGQLETMITARRLQELDLPALISEVKRLLNI